MAKTPRTWTGARTPSGLKRVRQAQSRHEVLQPRRTRREDVRREGPDALPPSPPMSTIDPEAALAEALSALDRAAKVGAIHPNAAARRKSRLTLKVNAALGWRRTSSRVAASTKIDRQGRRGEGRQGPHRRRQGRQGEGRPDRCRQGPRRAEQDGPRRGSCRQGRRRGRVRRPRPPRREAAPREDGDQGDRGQDDRQTTAAKKPAATKARSEGHRQGRSEGEEAAATK